MNDFRQHALDSASPVELVVALYDGIIRFLYAAADACDRGNADARRVAVKRALDIVMHLQARLRMDIGGTPAKSLSEFYAAIFAQVLLASQAASRVRFERAIDSVRNVRDAWREVAQNPSLFASPVNVLRMPAGSGSSLPSADADSTPSGWTA